MSFKITHTNPNGELLPGFGIDEFAVVRTVKEGLLAYSGDEGCDRTIFLVRYAVKYYPDAYSAWNFVMLVSGNAAVQWTIVAFGPPDMVLNAEYISHYAALLSSVCCILPTALSATTHARNLLFYIVRQEFTELTRLVSAKSG